MTWTCHYTTGGADPEQADGCDQPGTLFDPRTGHWYCDEHAPKDRALHFTEDLA